MDIRVRLFGPGARLIGRHEVCIALDHQPATCARLRASLGAAEPRLSPLLPSARFAVNCEFADDSREIGQHDEVALIGAVSGG
jgi:molybdopterin converting factor small subunit